MRGAPLPGRHGARARNGGRIGDVLRHRRERLAQLRLEAAEPLDAAAGLGHVRRKPVAEQLPELDGVAAPCPHRQHGADVRDGEAELAEVEDELELLERRPVVPAVPTLAHRDGMQEPLLLVEAHRADGLSRRPGQVSRGEHALHSPCWLMARPLRMQRRFAGRRGRRQPCERTWRAMTSRWISLVPS